MTHSASKVAGECNSSLQYNSWAGVVTGELTTAAGDAIGMQDDGYRITER